MSLGCSDEIKKSELTNRKSNKPHSPERGAVTDLDHSEGERQKEKAWQRNKSTQHRESAN